MLNRIRSGYHIEELETELGLQQKEVTCPLQSSKSSLHQMNLCVYIDIYIYISVHCGSSAYFAGVHGTWNGC